MPRSKGKTIFRILPTLIAMACLLPTALAQAGDAAVTGSVWTWMNEIKNELDAGHFQEGVPAARALARDVATLNLPDGTRAQVLQLAGRAEYEIGAYDDELRWDWQALPLAQSAHGRDSEEGASIEDDLGVALRHLGKFDEAELMFSAASKTFSEMSRPNQALFSELLINYAILAYDRGDVRKAEGLTYDALQRRRALDPPNPASVAQALDNYGVILQAEGRLAASKAPLEEALDLRRRTLRPRHPDIAASLNNIGVLEQQRGDFANAEQHLREAADIDAETFGKGDPQVLTDLSNLGEVLRSMDRPDEALALELEVLTGRRAQAKRLGVETTASLDLAISNGNVANLLRDLGRGDEAMEHYTEALNFDRERAGAEATTDIALDLNNVGEGFREAGDMQRARTAFEEGLSVAAKVGDSALRIEASLLHNYGVLLAGEGDLQNAELRLRAAVDIRTRVLPADHPDVAISRAWLAEVLSRRDSTEAIAQARSALSILETREGRGVIGFSAAAVAAEARSARAAVENILAVFASRGTNKGAVLATDVADDALAAIQIAQASGTAVVAARAASALLAADPRGAAILRQIEDLRDQREAAVRREALSAAGLDPGLGSQGAASSAELDGRLAKLLGAVPGDILSLTASPRLQLADLKPVLAQDEGWLGFVIGDSSITVALVTSAGLQLISVPEGRDRLARRVEELRNELDPRTTRRFDMIASHALYDLLLGPFGEPFARLSRLIVASDGPLESLPLSVLVTTAHLSSDDPDQAYRRSSWLSDRAVITITPSFATALASQQVHYPPSSTAGFLGFGDPALGPAQAPAADASASVLSKLMFLQGAPGALADVRALPSLPDTKAQLEAMNDLFADGRGDIRTGPAATKSAVQQAHLASFRVIAFATYGLLAAESPHRRAGACYDPVLGAGRWTPNRDGCRRPNFGRGFDRPFCLQHRRTAARIRHRRFVWLSAGLLSRRRTRSPGLTLACRRPRDECSHDPACFLKGAGYGGRVQHGCTIVA